MDSKIKQTKTIPIGQNIRNLRQAKGIGQTELVRLLQLRGIDITRESLVKIERGIQHIYASQLKGIRDVLKTTERSRRTIKSPQMGLFDFFARRALYTALSGLWGRDYQGKPCFPWFVGRFGTYPKRFQVFCNFFSKKLRNVFCFCQCTS